MRCKATEQWIFFHQYKAQKEKKIWFTTDFMKKFNFYAKWIGNYFLLKFSKLAEHALNFNIAGSATRDH